jgi:uncharacterized protein with HEPN domain
MRDDATRIREALEAIERVEKYSAKGRSAFDSDELIQTWIVHHLQILAEALTRTDESTRRQHEAIPWDKIRGMRNILVHEYFGIDKRLVWAVVESDLPELKEQLDSLLEQLS